MEKFGDPALFDKYSQSGENLGALFSAFKDIGGTLSGPPAAPGGGVFPSATVGGRFRINTNAHGGPFSAGQAMLVGEMGPEMILPDRSGMVYNTQRTQQMLQASLQRAVPAGGGAGGGITAVNTGGNNINNARTTNHISSPTAARRPIVLNTGTALA